MGYDTLLAEPIQKLIAEIIFLLHSELINATFIFILHIIFIIVHDYFNINILYFYVTK